MHPFFLVLIFVILLTAVYSLVRGIGWVPTWQKDIKRFLALAEIKAGQIVYDLGCGDGRLVMAAAKFDAKAVGLEISVIPFLFACLRKLFSRSKAQIKFRDFWMVDLSDADVVYFFLIPRVYPELKQKLEKELKPGTKVIAYVWPIEGWQASKIDRVAGQPNMYLYIK